MRGNSKMRENGLDIDDIIHINTDELLNFGIFIITIEYNFYTQKKYERNWKMWETKIEDIRREIVEPLALEMARKTGINWLLQIYEQAWKQNRIPEDQTKTLNFL